MAIMQQKYYCPNCGARIVCGERFCMGCGINFTWVMEPLQPQPAQPWYGDQYPGHQQGFDQQWPMYDQQSRLGRKPDLNDNSLSQRKNSQAGSKIAPISAEISRLLSDFEKHIKYNKLS